MRAFFWKRSHEIKATICVVGMGRVGLPLGLTLAGAGFKVLGVERDKNILASLNRGKPHFYEKGLEASLRKHLNKNLWITQDINNKQGTYIICVGTPMGKETKKVILTALTRATTDVAQQLEEGDTVVIRSTVPIGTTRNIILPLLSKREKRFYLAYCPERTVAGNALIELRELPQIVGGLNEESAERAVSIFSKITATTVRVASLEAAEMIKLVDNTYRDVNFAFANEVGLIAERAGLDAVELIKAANQGYSRNNIPAPGFVGGVCLAKDPYFFYQSALELGCDAKLAKLAREVNEHLPSHITQKLEAKLLGIGKNIRKAKILILGIAFKGQPETDDTRDSPALSLVNCLKNDYGCTRIYGHDFVVPAEVVARADIEYCSLEDGFKGADCAIFMNNHHSYYELNIEHLASLVNRPAVLIDNWHIFVPEDIKGLDGIVGF